VKDADAQVLKRLTMQDRLADALFVLGMMDKNNRIDAGEKGKVWSGRFVVDEVLRYSVRSSLGFGVTAPQRGNDGNEDLHDD